MNNKLIKEFEEVLSKNHFEVYKVSPQDLTDDVTHYYLVVGDTNSGPEATEKIHHVLESNDFELEYLDINNQLRNYGCSFDILASRENVDFCIEVNLKNQNRARFKRVSKRRVNEAIKKIKLIGHLSDKSNYSYTDEEIDEISISLENELQSAISRFRKTSGNTELTSAYQADSELCDEFQKLTVRQTEIQQDLSLLSQKLDRNLRSKEEAK